MTFEAVVCCAARPETLTSSSAASSAACSKASNMLTSTWTRLSKGGAAQLANDDDGATHVSLPHLLRLLHLSRTLSRTGVLLPGRLRNLAIRTAMVMMLRLLPPQPRPPLKVALLSLPMMMMVLLNLSLPHLLLLLHLHRRSRTGVLMPRQTRLKLPSCKQIASDTPSSMVTFSVAQASH